MSVLSEAEIRQYTSRLNTLSDATRKSLAKLLARIEYEDVADLRNQLIGIMEPFLGAATDAAAAYAADFYDTAREVAVGTAMGAEAVSGRAPEATAQAIRGILQRVVEGATLDGILDQLLDRADYEIKRAAGTCVMRNSANDPLSSGFARIPTGAETCDFCLMLASRGFAYKSAREAGDDGFHGTLLDHYHANCDCRIVPGFDGMEVEGYDPDYLYDQWKDSAHAEYMRRREAPKRSRKSGFEFKGDGSLPEFKTFADVRDYIYSAEDQKDLEHRFSILGNIFGFGSQQMRSQSLKNAVRHRQKRL